jgi:hypothetical protein
MSANEVIKDGYKRLIHNDSVDWYIFRNGSYDYCVARFPFVPDYHLCKFVSGGGDLPTEYPLQTFKTLTEALAVLRVLDASSPEVSDE